MLCRISWEFPKFCKSVIPPFSVKADSHIACRTHAAPIPFPCHAVALRIYNVSFPFVLHSVAVSDSHLPCHAHAMLRPCRSSQGHGTARPSRYGLWAICRVRLLPATTRSCTKVSIRRIAMSGTDGQCETKHRLSWTRKRVVAAHYKEDDLLHFWTSSSDISGYRADFHEGHGTVGAGQGRGMLCVN
jgi:hypothetical protein